MSPTRNNDAVKSGNLEEGNIYLPVHQSREEKGIDGERLGGDEVGAAAGAQVGAEPFKSFRA